jgi:carboxyl-terminal processing protease
VSTVEQNNTLMKIKEEMKVGSMEADKEKYFNNPDKTKGDFYQAWLKSLKTDIHIDESVKIVSEMAHQLPGQTVLK